MGARAQLAEQPRVPHRDHGLCSEVLKHGDLSIGERPYLLAIHKKDTEGPALGEHWHRQHCPSLPHFCGGNGQRISIEISSLFQIIGNLDCLFRGHSTAHRRPRTRVPTNLREHLEIAYGQWAVRGGQGKRFAVVQPEIAERRLTESYSPLQNALEYQREIPRRGIDDL